MSWNARTWQPAVRRDGPLTVAAAFFLLPALFFFTTWYASYFAGTTPTVVVTLAGAIALITPPLLSFHLAGRAGRRRTLWAFLVLSGLILSLWLPTRYLIPGGPLPPGAYIAIPEVLSQALAATVVSMIPLLMGAIPVVVYGLAIEMDRPLAGVPPRAAVLMTAGGGIILWAGALFVTLLNPVAPPFVPLGARIEVQIHLSPPPTLPGEIVPATWEALLWRLHDGLPPGATEVSSENDSLGLRLPAIVERQNFLNLLMGQGTVELVDAGDSPPAAGTSVSTTRRPLAGAEETLESVLAGEAFAQEEHWSGVGMRQVRLEERNNATVLVVTIAEEGQETLQRFAEENRGAFLSLVLDNVVLISFPALGAIENGTLVIRRVDSEIAAVLAAIMRYGPLPLLPEVEVVR